jgi:hypothetical protein
VLEQVEKTGAHVDSSIELAAQPSYHTTSYPPARTLQSLQIQYVQHHTQQNNPNNNKLIWHDIDIVDAVEGMAI